MHSVDSTLSQDKMKCCHAVGFMLPGNELS